MLQQVNKITIGENDGVCLMAEEIKDTVVNYFCISGLENITLPRCDNYVRILLVLAGSINIETEKLHYVGERTVIIPEVLSDVTISCNGSAECLELRRYLTSEEFVYCKDAKDLPYVMNYAEAPQYTESCKSPKTISRMLVPQRVIPRFAMGSVYSSGEDLVAPHAHPMLEQFFFGFQDNDCTLLINDVEYSFGGNTLVHIPLGSQHGVKTGKEQTMHYGWMDFLFDAAGLEYMDSAHHIIPGAKL